MGRVVIHKEEIRTIAHIDANSYYASVECLYDPSIRNKPVVVGGDPAARHGIVLTKNQIAKKYGIQTGEVLWQAKQKCPQLVIKKADPPKYKHFSEKLFRLYMEYTNKVERYGIDECWLDLTHPKMTFADGIRIADEIRQRSLDEFGLPLSAGVSYNKVFAKLGSDYKKPNATTAISRENYRDIVWPLPVSDLLFIGPANTAKLNMYNINTIGDLANHDPKFIFERFGKNGITAQLYAQGKDQSPVAEADATSIGKSVGNGITAPRDMKDIDDVRCIAYLLSESIAARLRDQGDKGCCVNVSVRTTDLIVYSCQRVIKPATNLTSEIAEMAITLIKERYMSLLPFRSLTITCSSLVPDTAPIQLDLLGNTLKREKAEIVERTADSIRKRFGFKIMQRGVVLANPLYAIANSKEDHTIHPVAFNRG